MKQIRTTTAIVILLVAIVSCRKENITESIKTGNVEFTFGLSQTEMTNPASAMISVTDAAGQPIYNNEQVTLTQTGDSYTTKALTFDPGNYKLTKFMIVDADGTALLATPMGFSSNADLVDSPLPIKFSVQQGMVTTLTPEVVSTLSKAPQELGYTSFKVNGQTSIDFQLMVYTFNTNTNQFEATTALFSLVSDAGETLSLNTSGAVETINVKEAKKYIITVSKEGYLSWSDTLSVNNLLLYYSSPMAIALDKTDDSSINFVTSQDTLTRLTVNFKSYDNTTPLRVNWGDGKIGMFTGTGKLTHDYAVEGNYKVRFTGNISAMYKIGLTHCQISSINLDKADHLTSIEISRNQKLKSLDLSKKPLLKEVLCVEGGIENLILTNSDSIELIYCSVNNLKSLDVTTLTNLKTLFCDRNNLTSLEIKNNVNLKTLFCYQNNLELLDITNNVGLETLDCRSNKLTFVDLSKSITIKKILLGSNNISNDNANKILADLLQTITANPRTEGQISINGSPKGAGQTSKETLEKTYLWAVSFI